MKHPFKLLAAAVCALFVTATTHAQTIDFEVANLNEGDQIFDQFANGTCGVKFYLDSETSGLHPVLAEVGDQANGAYFAFEGVTGTECGNASTDIDMPLPGQNLGCKFLTDDSIVGSNPKDLIVVWENTTLACSGMLLDIDATEMWKITAIDPFGNTLADQTISAGDPGTGDGVATPWSFSNIGVIKKLVFSPTSNANFGLAFDNFNTCSAVEETCCGGGVNYQKNSDFEDGDVYFNSSYDYQPNIAFSSVAPKEYSIVNSTEAATISPNWNVTGSTTCSASDKFMVVNGRTNLSGQKVVWRNTYTLEPNREWVFCVNLKHLPQCAFDIIPQIEILAGGTVLNTATINTDSNDPCDWQLVSTPFSTVGNTGNVAYTFKIRLAENQLGDGNDLAIDDVSMREQGPGPAPNTAFTFTTQHQGPQTFGVSAIQAEVEDGCSYAWTVCEVDANRNCVPGTEMTHASWQNYPNNETFNGYEGTSVWHANLPNGSFLYGHRYMITYTASCPCSEVVSESQTITAIPPSPKMNGALDKDASLENLQVFPNPTQGAFTIELPANSEAPIAVQVLDTKGQSVVSRELESGQREWKVQLPQLAEGVYLLQITNGTEMRTEKLIVRY